MLPNYDNSAARFATTTGIPGEFSRNGRSWQNF
jgi:hypothetical protein